jgi:hypothetical protein
MLDDVWPTFLSSKCCMKVCYRSNIYPWLNVITLSCNNVCYFLPQPSYSVQPPLLPPPAEWDPSPLRRKEISYSLGSLISVVSAALIHSLGLNFNISKKSYSTIVYASFPIVSEAYVLLLELNKFYTNLDWRSKPLLSLKYALTTILGEIWRSARILQTRARDEQHSPYLNSLWIPTK